MKSLLLLLAASVACFGQTVTWTKAWTSPNTGTFGTYFNGYEDIHYDPWTNKTWLYTTDTSNTGDGIYSIRLHYFDAVAKTDTTIGDNGQAVTGGCLASSLTWPFTHHVVSQWAVDTIRHRMLVAEGTSCAAIGAEQWYYQLTNPIDGHATWTPTQPPHLPMAISQNTTWRQTTLSGSILAGDTTLSLVKPDGFAQNSFIKIDSEFIKITANGSYWGYTGAGTGTAGTNPLTIERGAYGTTPAAHTSGVTVFGMEGLFNGGAIAYDPTDDVFVLLGLPGSGSGTQWQVYCDTSQNLTPGTLTALQTGAGCANPDDWTNLSAKSICADATNCTAVTTGTNGPNSGKVPKGNYYPNMDWDAANHRFLSWGGSFGASTQQFVLWAYDVPTKTWTNLAPACVDAACVNGQPPFMSTNSENFRMMHTIGPDGTYYYHLTRRPSDTTTVTQDWAYSPTMNAWTKYNTGSGPNYGETMTFDTSCSCLIAWGISTSGASLAEIWIGQLPVPTPTITTTSPLTTGTQYSSYSVTLAATNTPTSWAITAGTLPTGISFNTSTGVISGKPTQGGSWSITVTATNGGGTSSPVVFALPITVSPGLGNSTTNCVDVDGDGYGVGPGCLGTDADDTDATVITASDALAKYTTLAAFWTHMGWSPSNVLYVDGGAGSCTAIATPFVYDATKGCATISAAITAMSAGYALVLRAGTYAQGASTILLKAGTLSGTTCTAKNYYLAYPGEAVEVTFAGGQMSIQGASQSCFTVHGIKWTQNSHGLGKGFGATLITPMYGWTIDHNEVSGFTDNVFPQSRQHGTQILHNYIHDAYAGGDFGHDIYLGSNFSDSADSVIRGNIVANADDTCIHMNGPMTNITVDSNLLYGCSKGINNQNGVNHSTFQNNVVHTDARYLFYFSTYSSTFASNTWQCSDTNFNVVRNNVFYDDNQSFNLSRNSIDAGSTDFYLVDGGGTDPGGCLASVGHVPDIGHNTYDNNIVVHNCSTNCFASGTVNPALAGPLIRYASLDDGGVAAALWLSTDTWRNNVLKNFDVSTKIIDPGTSVNQNCSWFTNTSNVPGGSGNLCNSDPLLSATNPVAWATLPANWNLAPQLGSPAIGAALLSDAATYDVIGAVRSLTTPSIGGYESSVAASGVASQLVIGTVVRH